AYVQTSSHPFLHALLTLLDQLLQKLMAKTPEERFQSTSGLLSDLAAILQIVQEQQARELEPSTPSVPAASEASKAAAGVAALQAFRIGALDQVSTFRISQRLYGRDQDMAKLIDCYNRVCA